MIVTAITACGTAGEVGPPGQTGSPLTTPPVGERFPIAGEPSRPSDETPPKEIVTTFTRGFAFWTSGGLVVGTYGSGSCPNVPVGIEETGPQEARVLLLSSAKIDGNEAYIPDGDQPCTADLTPTDFLIRNPPLDPAKDSAVTLDIADTRPNATGADAKVIVKLPPRGKGTIEIIDDPLAVQLGCNPTGIASGPAADGPGFTRATNEEALHAYLEAVGGGATARKYDQELHGHSRFAEPGVDTYLIYRNGEGLNTVSVRKGSVMVSRTC